jgi:hypothetical protein
MWMRGLGIADEARAENAVKLEGEEVRGFITESHGGYGPMSHLRPAVRMSRTQPHWARPVVKLGTHPAAWPERGERLVAAQ